MDELADDFREADRLGEHADMAGALERDVPGAVYL
jgi:hypothetical protein